jgi:hypothetical protein
MISLPKLYDFRHSVGTILPVMLISKKIRTSGNPKREEHTVCKLQWKAFQLDGK